MDSRKEVYLLIVSSSTTFDVIISWSPIAVRSRVETRMIMYVHQEAMYECPSSTDNTRIAVSSSSRFPETSTT